jgi:hypothetical protein
MEIMSWSRRIRVQIIVPALILLCLSAGGGAYAAEGELPCAEEIAKYCKDVKPGGGRILDCLNGHQQDLSITCSRKLEESKQKLMEAQQACTGDMEKFCKDVQPGQGRILNCLREHAQELSPACSQIIGKTMGKVQEKQQSGQQEKSQ